MNVLVVDPDPEFATSIRTRLASPEMTVEMAETGTDAWMILATFKHRFDALLLDLSLPDLDGIELLGRIKSSPKHSGIPVIVCTTVNRRETVARAIRYGVSHYLIKPCSDETVCRKLLDVTQVDRSGSPALAAAS